MLINYINSIHFYDFFDSFKIKIHLFIGIIYILKSDL